MRQRAIIGYAALAAAGVFLFPCTARAEKTLGVQTAQTLALANSTEYKQADSEARLKEIEYQAAVKNAQRNAGNRSAVRWNPLMSFTLPEEESLSEAYEEAYLPVQLTAQIDSAKHQRDTAVYEVNETVGNLFTEVYTLQETAKFYEKRLEDAKEKEKRMQARVLSGDASAKEAEDAAAKREGIETELLGTLREFESAKKKLGDAAGLDVSSGYTFESPYQNADLSRDALEDMKEQALLEEQEYYGAGLETEQKRIALDSDYELLEERFGSAVEVLKPYIDAAKDGEAVDSGAFMELYDKTLSSIDSEWDGETKILSVSIPEEWMKGETDGTRYLADDAYALCTDLLEYRQARETQETVKQELISSVEEKYDAAVAARNSYETLSKTAEDSEKELYAAGLLQKAGELSETEKDALNTTHEENLLAEQEALSSYTQALYALDRVSCGGITALMYPAGEERQTKEEELTEAKYADGAVYYIKSVAASQVFVLGVTIPEDFPVEITDFELWVDGVQIGERTSADTALRHLALGLERTETVILRFYNGDTFVSDCEIDPKEYAGELKIVEDYVPKQEDDGEILAEYTTSTGTQTAAVTVTAAEGEEEAAYYSLLDSSGKALGGGKLVRLGGKFSYLALLLESLDTMQVQFYDEQKEELYVGYFDTENGVIRKKTES